MQQEFGRSLNKLKNIVDFTDNFFAAHDIDPSVRYIVDLCVEELFVNMVTYDTETKTDILIEMQPHERGVEVSLTGFGVERFDPREVDPVDVDAPLEQRTPGGLGLYLVLKMVSSIHYEYRDRNSKITFIADRK
ncbi:MAG: ATP-binding protein [Gammaproteobacteria bacterium]|nr:ATP-binding protein [Gammaproteobacteria bacterium]MDH3373740.1 ATP-binding protein [Gammaproteobacteria bacterium]MDH3410579.1 ATP-binding protein [Gammaproteobacteria bacterium]